MNPDTYLVVLAVAAVAVLVSLITMLKWNPFLALLTASLILGLGAQKPFDVILTAFRDGLGATLGGIAGVIGLGVMLGKLLAESGGATVLATRMNAFFGPQRVVWCVMALALAVGLTTWFAVGLVLLLPILLTLTRESGRPFLAIAIPLLSCLSVMHGLMPPHPGPVVAVEALHASMGKVLGWGFLIGIPTAAIAGPLFARWAVAHVPAAAPSENMIAAAPGQEVKPPSLARTVAAISLPVALMLLAALAELTLPKENIIRVYATALGNPTMALAISLVFALWALGTACGISRARLLTFTEQSVAGVGMTLLVVGAGGGFARVLREAGVADALGNMAAHFHLPPLVYGWMVAAFIRVATGSATVAITAASGVLAPLVIANPEINRELLVISIGCGSLFLSHLNDGGFWIVKECLGLTVGQTLRTWTVTETIVGIAGLGITILVDMVV